MKGKGGVLSLDKEYWEEEEDEEEEEEVEEDIPEKVLKS
jgi:hypothetical protein